MNHNATIWTPHVKNVKDLHLKNIHAYYTGSGYSHVIQIEGDFDELREHANKMAKFNPNSNDVHSLIHKAIDDNDPYEFVSLVYYADHANMLTEDTENNGILFEYIKFGLGKFSQHILIQEDLSINESYDNLK